MEAWLKCEKVEENGKAAQRADDLLRSMIEVYRRDRSPDSKPNKMCFTTCITAWARARSRSDAPERAETLLGTIIDLHRETSDDDFFPDVNVFNAVIGCIVRSTDGPNAMTRAQGLLQLLRKFTEPDLVTFNTILSGMGKRGMGEEAMQLLDWLETVGGDSPKLLPKRYL
jgi:hypothetical protein